MVVDNMRTGHADCIRLHIHTKPDLDSEIVCKVRYLTNLEISLEESTEDFYKVYTATGASGYCKKDQVFIK